MLVWALNTISTATVFLSPVLVLPIALSNSYYLALRLSFMFCLYHLLIACFKKLVPSLFTTENTFSWLIEFVLLAAFGLFLQPLLPSFLEVFYGHLLSWAGPVFFLVQAVQVVRLIMEIGKIFAARREDNIVLIETIVNITFFASYVMCVILVYFLFSFEITVGLASFLSITCTIIVGLTILTWVIARAEPPFTGCPTDVALVSLFLIYIARLAIIETPSITGLSADDPSSSALFRVLNVLGMSASTYNNVGSLLSFDSILATLLAIVTMVSLPTLPWYGDEDTTTNVFDELAAGVKPNLFGILGIMIYTHLILSITGNIAHVSFGWRIAQSVVCMSYYTYTLVSPKHSHGD